MSLYHYKLIEKNFISDHGTHELSGEVAAQIGAIQLARSLRTTHPELRGKNCSVSVTDSEGVRIWVIPLEFS